MEGILVELWKIFGCIYRSDFKEEASLSIIICMDELCVVSILSQRCLRALANSELMHVPYKNMKYFYCLINIQSTNWHSYWKIDLLHWSTYPRIWMCDGNNSWRRCTFWMARLVLLYNAKVFQCIQLEWYQLSISSEVKIHQGFIHYITV